MKPSWRDLFAIEYLVIEYGPSYFLSEMLKEPEGGLTDFGNCLF